MPARLRLAATQTVGVPHISLSGSDSSPAAPEIGGEFQRLIKEPASLRLRRPTQVSSLRAHQTTRRHKRENHVLRPSPLGLKQPGTLLYIPSACRVQRPWRANDRQQNKIDHMGSR